MKQLAHTPENARALYERYYHRVALFMEEIVGMDLDDWQRDLCDDFHNHNRFAISSGHSVGKTGLASGLIIFFMTMHPSPQVIVTANTGNQLTQKTWRELAKWHHKSRLRNWFRWTATTFSMIGSDTWFAAAVPQTEHNSQAFAGAHERFMLQIFDEASIIPQTIYEVTEGATALEDGYRKWFIFGNPTETSGSFYEACFGNQSHRWHSVILDARKCKYADQEQIQRWKDDYGEDSDFFRVRVLGLPPEQSITTLIGLKDVSDATTRPMPEESYRFAPKILGVDCARFGDDDTVICFRQGLKVHWFKSYHGLDEMEIAQKVANEINDIHPSAVFFDNTGGYGAGAHDRLKQLKYDVVGVNFASTKGIDEIYQNFRMYMWDQIRIWIADGSIPDDSKFARELSSVQFGYNMNTGKKQLESKDDVKKRLGRSPDRADALALTFSYPVQVDGPEQRYTKAELDWRKITGLDNEDSAWILD